MSGDLGGLLDPQSSGFDDSDEFDAAALLSQPLFNDSQGDLNVPNDLLPGQGDEMMTTESAASNQQNHALLMQQQRERLQAFQMQQQQQHGGFQQHNQQLPQDYSDPSQQHQQQQQMQNQNQFGGGFNQADSQMGNASFNMSDVQVQQNFQQLQQFQNQQQMNNSQSMMQQQMNNSQSMMQQQMNNSQHNMMQQMNNSQHNMMQQDGQSMMQQQNQQGFQNMQGGGMNSAMHSSRMNNSGADFSRAPPGRSVSMPIQRMYGSSSVGKSNELLMMQQQQQLQAMQNGMFQQQQQQQRDMDTSQQSHTSMQIASNMGGRGGLGQQQNMEGSLSSLGPPMMPQRNNSLPHPPESGMQGQSPIVQSPKMIPNNLQGAMFSPQKGSDGSEPPATVNEAMEKLCESMRRSAMSRSLVKQLSGRSAPQRGNLTATNSARMRQLMGGSTGRSVARANSGRSVQRSHSGRAGLGMDNAPNMPVRRVAHDSKHRMGARPEPSSRGVFRHQSAAAVMLQRRNPFPNNPQEFNPNGSGSSGGSGEG